MSESYQGGHARHLPRPFAVVVVVGNEPAVASAVVGFAVAVEAGAAAGLGFGHVVVVAVAVVEAVEVADAVADVTAAVAVVAAVAAAAFAVVTAVEPVGGQLLASAGPVAAPGSLAAACVQRWDYLESNHSLQEHWHFQEQRTVLQSWVRVPHLLQGPMMVPFSLISSYGFLSSASRVHSRQAV